MVFLGWLWAGLLLVRVRLPNGTVRRLEVDSGRPPTLSGLAQVLRCTFNETQFRFRQRVVNVTEVLAVSGSDDAMATTQLIDGEYITSLSSSPALPRTTDSGDPDDVHATTSTSLTDRPGSVVHKRVVRTSSWVRTVRRHHNNKENSLAAVDLRRLSLMSGSTVKIGKSASAAILRGFHHKVKHDAVTFALLLGRVTESPDNNSTSCFIDGMLEFSIDAADLGLSGSIFNSSKFNEIVHICAQIGLYIVGLGFQLPKNLISCQLLPFHIIIASELSSYLQTVGAAPNDGKYGPVVLLSGSVGCNLTFEVVADIHHEAGLLINIVFFAVGIFVAAVHYGIDTGWCSAATIKLHSAAVRRQCFFAAANEYCLDFYGTNHYSN
jgi:hypothetical protein